MTSIDLANIDSIVTDDTALSKLVRSYIKDESGDFVFVLPEGTSDSTRKMFDDFINKVNFEFNRVSRDTRIQPAQIKVPVVVPQPVVVPEPASEVVAEPVVTETSKRKK